VNEKGDSSGRAGAEYRPSGAARRTSADAALAKSTSARGKADPTSALADSTPSRTEFLRAIAAVERRMPR